MGFGRDEKHPGRRVLRGRWGNRRSANGEELESGDVEMEEMGRQAGVECVAAVAIDMNAVTLAAEVDGGVTLIDRYRDSRLLQTLRQA